MKSAHQRGFTLIELIIFIVVVSAGLAGILSVMDTSVKSSADPMVRKQTVAIAESLLEEILLKDYANPSGGYSGTDRAQFDDVDDYAGYSTSAGIVDALGTATPGLTQYNISPAVSVVASTDLTGVAAKKITVSVTGTGGTISLSGYRANY
jgi:MSHA pilin protein MshD